MGETEWTESPPNGELEGRFADFDGSDIEMRNPLGGAQA